MKIFTYSFAVLLFMATLVSGAAADVPTFSIASGDVTETAVKMNNYKHSTNHTSLEIVLTASKQAEMTRFTTANLGKTTRLVINGKLWGTPLIHDVSTSRIFDLSITSPEQGLTLAKALLKRQ